MILKHSMKAGVLFAAVSSICLASKASAALTLVLSETGVASPPTPITVTDTTNSGTVSYEGTFGAFTTTLDFGFSNKLTATGLTQATLDVTSIDVSNVGTPGTYATLVLTLTDSGFTFPGAPGSKLELGSAITGTFTPPLSGEGVTFQSYETTTGASTGPQSSQATLNPLTGSFSDNANPAFFTRGTTYGLESVTGITLESGGDITSVSGTTTVVQVPEPVTGGMLLTAGLLATLRRTRRPSSSSATPVV